MTDTQDLAFFSGNLIVSITLRVLVALSGDAALHALAGEYSLTPLEDDCKLIREVLDDVLRQGRTRDSAA